MQTVNFNCSLCDKLMAVGLTLLGRNVRCPHCKHVVQAPANPAELRPGARQKTQADDSAPLVPPIDMSAEGASGRFARAARDREFAYESTGSEIPRQVQSSATASHTLGGMGSLGDSNEITADPFADLLSAPLFNVKPDGGTFAVEAPRGKGNDESAGGLSPPLTGEPSGVLVWILLAYSVIMTGVAAYLFFEMNK